MSHKPKDENVVPAKPATKIRIIEDADATGDVAAAYDYWRAGSGRKQVPGIIKCFGARPDFLRRYSNFPTLFISPKGIFRAAIRK